jgi:hypothetical protein
LIPKDYVFMDERGDLLKPIEVPSLHVSVVHGAHVVSLRHFDSEGQFARAVEGIIGAPLPGLLATELATRSPPRYWAILAWQTPTEALLLCDDELPIEKLSAEVSALTDGCVIDQTGGMKVLRMSGEGVQSMVARISGQATYPQIGQARRGRFADVPVLALQAHPGEILLVVERLYMEHLMESIRVSAGDLSDTLDLGWWQTGGAP